MEKEELLNFIRQHTTAVLATVSATGRPQSAAIGIAAAPGLLIVFDTVNTSRKYQNIMHNPFVSLVIGWENEITVQYEGMAEEIHSKDNPLVASYFEVFPDGKERLSWPGITHFVITPKWIRYSNFNSPQLIREFEF